MPIMDLSILLFAAFTVYVFMGLYILSLNIKSILNKMFFAICVSLCIWALTFSLANFTQDYETAVLWRRAAALGWGFIFSFVVHFSLILTENTEILKKRWIYPLIYLPAAVTVFAYCLDGRIAREQYDLVFTEVGWINLTVMNGWMIFLYAYYLLFTFISVGLLWRWRRKIDDPEKKKQPYILLASFAVAIFIGTITELILNKYTSAVVPQISPMIAMIPIITVYYSIKRYDLMAPVTKNKAESGMILSETNYEKIYHIVSVAFIFGGMFNFVIRYFFGQEDLWAAAKLSAVLFLMGFILRLVQLLNLKIKENLFIIFITVTIPLITLRHTEYAGVTVWAIPTFFIMLSVVFNSKKMLICVGSVFLLTQIVLWAAVPDATVHIESSDYVSRIALVIFLICTAYSINKIYLNRLRENESQIKFQNMVSKISAEFISISESNIDEKMDLFLEMNGSHFGADRCYFISLKDSIKSYEWCKEGMEKSLDDILPVNKEKYAWWTRKIAQNNLIYIHDVDDFPPEATKEKELVDKLDFKSVISISITKKGEHLGFLMFATIGKTDNLKEMDKGLFKILATLLSNALFKLESEKEIRYLAYYDPLTGLPNRMLLKNRLEQSIHLAKRSEKLIGVVCADLDFFKSINDTLGHDSGDELLKQISERLSDCVRKYDTVSRFGGDEFVITLNQMEKEEDIRKIVDNIMEKISQPVILQEQEFFITASVGISVYPVDGEDTETLIKNADLAMYTAKDNGKNQYAFCTAEIKEDVLKKLKLTNSLYRALERDEFMVYYQPQVSVVTKAIIGLEALLRWKHPDYGFVSPGEFIPLAEKTGLINSIGQWVLDTACHQSKEWQDKGLPPIIMAVNLSVEQLRNPNIINQVSRTLENTQLDSNYLELEITESTAVNERGYIVEILEGLKKLGVNIAIDDFGTEYSSLSRLKSLPIDRLKIDIQFVRGIAKSKKDEAIAKTIIQLAKNLELNVIAEGVEDEIQYEFFRKERCDDIQGFLFYRPMPTAEVETILDQQFRKE